MNKSIPDVRIGKLKCVEVNYEMPNQVGQDVWSGSVLLLPV
jgi:hypothetical protein